MRLLNTQSLRLEELNENDFIAYAILSHTWEEGEVTFADMQDVSVRASIKPGYPKVLAACQQAYKDGWQYIWIDSTCIDKSSSTDLTESINSMFRYYRQAGICYAYLSDVVPSCQPEFTETFEKARWFTRGWTLQELLAPRDVLFFAQDWSFIGAKADMVDQISNITGIERGFLRGAELGLASVAKRLSWAAERVTTRIEDQAYCLLGIFDVFMPMLYGEGRHAFRRLQEEIMKRTNDQSLLAWGYTPPTRRTDFPSNGFFARTPWAFAQSRNIVPYPQWPCATPWAITAMGIRMDAPVIDATGIVESTDILMAIGCHLEDNDRDVLALCLVNMQGNTYKRQFKTPILVPRDLWMKKKSVARRLFIIPSNLDNRLGWDENKHSIDKAIIFRFCPLSRRGYSISKTEPPGFWDERSSRLLLKQSSLDLEGERLWNVILHIADENDNIKFNIHVESESQNKLTFSVISCTEEHIETIDMDDQCLSRVCKVKNETFDFQARFQAIWAGELINIINMDIWSIPQLKNRMVRQIRESAEAIRSTGLMGKHAEEAAMPSTRRSSTFPIPQLIRSNTSKSVVVQQSRNRRKWMFWVT